MIIGICGKSGSGKSTLAKKLQEYSSNIIHLEIDKVGHKALADKDVKKELINCFGESILNDNNIDRKKLGNIVFNSRIEMKKLSDITWNYMENVIDRFIQDNKDKIIILDYILLPLTKFFDECDIKILLDIDYEIRKDRAIKRDNINEEAFLLREKASINYDKTKFDYVIKNIKDEEIKRLVKLL